MMSLKKVFLLLIALFIIYVHSATAKMTVDITRGNTKKISIAFSDTSKPEDLITKEIIKIIKADLIRSGLFEIKHDLSSNKPSQQDDEKPISLLTTSARTLADNRIALQYRLLDTSRKKQLLGKSLKAGKRDLRRMAHIIADSIYSRMTGEQGYFDSRIVYVAEFKDNKKVAIMDQDGANRYYLTNGDNLVLTPRFSPMSQSIVYMAYENTAGRVYMRDLDSGEETLIGGNFSGISSAPRFSPDGKSILIAKSAKGSTDIHEVSLKDYKKRRLTTKTAINTSPCYSPDQKRLIFVSDREGSPQLYIMTAEGRKQRRITFNQGSYTTPVWSPRGDWIAFTKTIQGKFYIGVMKPDGSSERLLATGHLVEAPTWSPNGRIILFSKYVKLPNALRESRLHSVDLTGEHERLINTSTSASDPAWSPLLSQQS